MRLPLPEGLKSGRAAFLAAFAAAAVPAPPMDVNAWAEETRVVAAESGSPLPGRWSNAHAPYLREIQDCLSLAHPSASVVSKASAQSAKTEAGVNLIGALIDQAPAPILVVLPTIEEAGKFNKLKLQPTIDATPALAAKVLPPNSRDEQSSTAFFKRFRGGYLALTGANSSSGLQMVSARVLVATEISEYPAEADDRGDPLELAEARLTAWLSRGVKIYYDSTPSLAGACRISAKYEASDQRRFYVPCPSCGAYQVLRWAPDSPAGALKWRADAPPFGAYYVCAAHGCVIEHHQKRAMVAGGVWIKTFPLDDQDTRPPEVIEAAALEAWRARDSAGRAPGFAWWQAYVEFVPWDTIVAKYLAAKDDPSKLKVFWQQVLGEAWEEKGEAPDYERLFDRRESFAWRRVPDGALFLTGAADVQNDRIEWDVFAWAADFSSWRIDGGVVEGPTDDAATWRKLDEVVDRRYADARGNAWPVDAFGIDAGYRSQMVYAYVRRHAALERLYALDGRPGWKLPPLGTPSKRAVDFEGRKIGAVRLWPVGTYDMKSALYDALRKTIEGPGEDGRWKAGAAHFNEASDREYFKQLTAEFVADQPARSGVVHKVWQRDRSRANERHDVAVYARALAHHVTVGMGPAEFAKLAAHRQVPAAAVQRDLAALWAAPAAPEAAAPASTGPRRLADPGQSGPVRRLKADA